MDVSAIEHIECRMIMVRGDARPLNTELIGELQASIESFGLRQPIIVRRKRIWAHTKYADGYELVAGRHRLTVFQKLGRETIPATIMETNDVDAEITMYDENIIRMGYTDAELKVVLPRRKELYELKFPGTKRESTLKQNTPFRQFGETERPDRFTKTIAKATGKSERTIQRLVSIGESLGEIVLGRISGTSLDSQVEQEALAALPEAQREELVERAVRGEPVSARREQSPGIATKQGDSQSDTDAEEQRFWDFWASLSPAARRRILPQLKALSA